MTEKEALLLRTNTAKLFQQFKYAWFNTVLPPSKAKHSWQMFHFDDMFYELGSQGYRQLIEDGWNPMLVTDDD